MNVLIHIKPNNNRRGIIYWGLTFQVRLRVGHCRPIIGLTAAFRPKIVTVIYIYINSVYIYIHNSETLLIQQGQ